MLEPSKITVGQKTYDLNYLTRAKKTALRRKLIVEFIESKPSGQTIRLREFQDAGRFSTDANAWAFIKRMIRDGIIRQHKGDTPQARYYSVLGTVRTRKVTPPFEGTTTPISAPQESKPTLIMPPTASALYVAINDLKKMGIKFTITINSEVGSE